MHRTRRAICTFFVTALLTPSVALSDFTFGILPDIQTYTARRPQILDAQMDWISLNRTIENIVYVSQLGDLKDVGACINGTIAWPSLAAPSTEWQIVRRAFDKLDTAGIPYGVSPGNHDFDQRNGVFPGDGGGCPNFDTVRPLVGYNSEFTPATLSQLFGVNYDNRIGGSNEDNYVTVSAEGFDFIFINLGYQEEAPAAGSTASIDWAEELLRDDFPNHIAIITSHFLVDCNKTPTGQDVSSNSPCADTPATYNQVSTYGANIVTRLRQYQNLFMLIGGHRFGEAYDQLDRSDLTDNNGQSFPPIHAVLANYQHLQYSATNFDNVNVPGPSGGSSGYFKLMEFDTTGMTVDMVSVSPQLDINAGIAGGGNVVSVLSNADRPNTVRSTRDIDVNNLADRFDGNGRSLVHNRSVSNLVNISFANYATATPPGPQPFLLTGSRANDSFFRFLANRVISAAEVDDRCADVDGCRITLTRVYGGATNVLGPINFRTVLGTSQFQILDANGNVTRNGTSANGLTEEILGPRADTNCWFSDWDTSGNTGNGDQNLNWAVIIWNTTATNLSCTFSIED